MKIVIFAVLLLLLTSGKVYSANTDIVINEVFPDPEDSEDAEFIELYNKGSETVTITDWKISDTSGSTSTYTIPENTMSPGSYKSFRRSTSGVVLNNDGGDGVILKDNTNQQIDSMSFGSSMEGKSWSRVPNGTGSFSNNTTSTENSPNSEPPTPTPSNTPTPTNIPTPTKTPTPTNAPTSTPPSTPSPTAKGSITPTITPKVSISPTPEEQEEAMFTTMQGEEQQKKDVLGVELGGKLSDLDKKETQYNWAKLLILMGAVIVAGACGVFVYNNYQKEKTEEISGSN